MDSSIVALDGVHIARSVDRSHQIARRSRVRAPGIRDGAVAASRATAASHGYWIGPITGIRISGANIAQRIAATICPHDSVR